MASLGNVAASALLNSAAAAQTKAEAFSDTEQQYNYALSAKTGSDYQTYQDYLNGRIKTLQSRGNDISTESKTLSLSKELTSANKSFTSATIARTSDAILYGDANISDKIGVLQQLQQRAWDNGDEALAQSLQGQIASAQITAQNEAQRASDQAHSASVKAIKGQITAVQQAIGSLDALKAEGKISSALYNAGIKQAYAGSPDKGTPGIIDLYQHAQQIDPDNADTYQDKINGLASKPEVQGIMNGTSDAIARQGIIGQVLHFDPNTNSFKYSDRPTADNGPRIPLTNPDGSPLLDQNGHAITAPTYHLGAQVNGKDLTGFEYGTQIDDGTGKFVNGKGGVNTAVHVDPSQLSVDPATGVKYFFTPDGQKKYVAVDPTNGKNIMANTPELLQGLEGTATYQKDGIVKSIKDEAKNFADSTTGTYLTQNLPAEVTTAAHFGKQAIAGGAKVLAGVGSFLSGGSSLGNIIAGHEQQVKTNQAVADAQAQAQAAAASRQAALTYHAPAPVVGAPKPAAQAPVFSNPTTTAQREVNTTQAINSAVGGLYKNLIPTAAPVASNNKSSNNGIGSTIGNALGAVGHAVGSFFGF